MKHELPKLKYSYTDLEPYIDAITMEIHYSKHHQGYVNKLNTALEKYPEFRKKCRRLTKRFKFSTTRYSNSS